MRTFRHLPALLLAAGLFVAALLTPRMPGSPAELAIGPLVLLAGIGLAWFASGHRGATVIAPAAALILSLAIVVASAVVAVSNPAGMGALVVTLGAASGVLLLPHRRCATAS